MEPGLRERKKKATREALTAAARRLVSEHGLDSVTTEMICADADVSVRTFFNYFDSKVSAVLGADRPVGTPESRAEFLAGGPSGALVADLLELIFPEELLVAAKRDEMLGVMRLMEAEPRLLVAQFARISNHEREVAELVAQRTGKDPDDPICYTAAALGFALVRRACVEWMHHDGRDAHECVAEVRAHATELLRLH